MSRRVEPVRKTTADILADLRRGHHEANLVGPAAALRFLERTATAQHSLPNAVKFFLWDLTAEAAFGAGEPDKVEAAVQACLRHLPDAEADLPVELKRHLPELRFFERGISVRSDAGDFEGALALCDLAVALGLGAHYTSKRDSLAWAR